MQKSNSDPIEKEINGEPEWTVIWLHGLGADGNDFLPIISELNLNDDVGVRFIFPHAPYRPITVNGGMTMRGWYDITSLDRNGNQDEDGILQSVGDLRKLIDRELDRGIPQNKIIIAGFSQGGAIAIYTALTLASELGGLIALSTYMPLEKKFTDLAKNSNKLQSSKLPIFFAHGSYDPVIPLSYGEKTKSFIEQFGYTVDWNEYPIEHSVSQREIKDIGQWISRVLEL